MNQFTDQQLESFVPVYDAIPDKWEDARPFVVEMLKKISNAINVREIGWFLDEELLSGKVFFPGPPTSANNQSQVYRQILRKVVDVGPLPNAGVKLVPHGITFDTNFSLIALYGGATDPTNLLAIPLPTVAINPNFGVEIFLTSTNISINTGTFDRSTYTRAYVIIEYIQEL